MTLWQPLATVFLECLERTIPYIQRFLRLPFPVRVRWMEDIMLTLKLSAKPSTFAQLMGLEVWPSTASSVPMVPSSTRTTSSATGGSTLTAPLLRNSTLSMTRLLLNVKLLTVPPLMLWISTKLQQMRVMLPLPPMRRLPGLAGGSAAGGTTGGQWLAGGGTGDRDK